MSYIMLFTALAIVASLVIFWKYRNYFLEPFINDRKPKDGAPVQVGVLNNTPGPIKDLMTELNKTGGQLVADGQYDQVPTEYLDRDKIKN